MFLKIFIVFFHPLILQRVFPLEKLNHLTVYLRSEPVPITFSLQNNSAAPVNYKLILGFGPNSVIKVTNPEEQIVEIKGSEIESGKGFLIASNHRLAPAGQEQSRSIFGFDSVERIFPQPGLYKIQILLSDGPTQTISSNVLTVEIKNPQGVDSAAYNYLTDTVKPAERTNKPVQLTSIYQQFGANYTGSVYWKYMVLKLASHHQRTGNLQAALNQLCNISSTNFYYSDEVSKRLEKINLTLHPVPLIQNLPENAPVPVPVSDCLAND